MYATAARRLKVSHLSTGLFVVLLVKAELSTFKSKQALASSHTATEDKLSPFFFCQEAGVERHMYKQRENNSYYTLLFCRKEYSKTEYRVTFEINQTFIYSTFHTTSFT